MRDDEHVRLGAREHERNARDEAAERRRRGSRRPAAASSGGCDAIQARYSSSGRRRTAPKSMSPRSSTISRGTSRPASAIAAVSRARSARLVRQTSTRACERRVRGRAPVPVRRRSAARRRRRRPRRRFALAVPREDDVIHPRPTAAPGCLRRASAPRAPSCPPRAGASRSCGTSRPGTGSPPGRGRSRATSAPGRPSGSSRRACRSASCGTLDSSSYMQSECSISAPSSASFLPRPWSPRSRSSGG